MGWDECNTSSQKQQKGDRSVDVKRCRGKKGVWETRAGAHWAADPKGGARAGTTGIEPETTVRGQRRTNAPRGLSPALFEVNTNLKFSTTLAVKLPPTFTISALTTEHPQYLQYLNSLSAEVQRAPA